MDITAGCGSKIWQVYIIIIMSCHRHGYPWSSLATSPYRSSPLAGLLGYIPYPHIAAVCMYELVVLLLPGQMWGSIGVHHLWKYIYIYIYIWWLSSRFRAWPPPLSYVLSPFPYPLKFYVFVSDFSGLLSCDCFYHRIGTTDQFCL